MVAQDMVGIQWLGGSGGHVWWLSGWGSGGHAWWLHIKTTQCKMSNLSNLFLKIFQGVRLIQNFIGQAQREKADSLRLWDTRKYRKYSYIATTIYGICILILYYSFVASTTGLSLIP